MIHDFRFAFRQLRKSPGFTAAAITVLALGTGKVASSLLFEVSAVDPVAFTFAPGLLALAAMLATWLPARRATKISPMEALRIE